MLVPAGTIEEIADPGRLWKVHVVSRRDVSLSLTSLVVGSRSVLSESSRRSSVPAPTGGPGTHRRVAHGASPRFAYAWTARSFAQASSSQPKMS
jgi:hypothetical protein